MKKEINRKGWTRVVTFDNRPQMLKYFLKARNIPNIVYITCGLNAREHQYEVCYEMKKDKKSS